MRSLRLPKSRVRRLSTRKSLRETSRLTATYVGALGSRAGILRIDPNARYWFQKGGSPRFPANGARPAIAQATLNHLRFGGLTLFARKWGLPPFLRTPPRRRFPSWAR